MTRFLYCDGAQPVYQLSLAGSQPYSAAVTDLGSVSGRSDVSGDGSTIAYKMTRPATQLAVAPQDVTFSTGGIVNAATLTAGIAPGGLMTILGSGLAGPGASSAVDVNGVAAKVAFQSPFRISAEVPPDLAPGSYSLQIRSPYGSAAQDVEVLASAPAIYLISSGNDPGSKARGVVTNPDNSINSSSAPIKRGQSLTIYCTGLGAVSGSGNIFRTRTPVSAVLNGAPIAASFAGLSPGIVGLYQVNLTVPVGTAPGIDLPLLLRESERDSNTVFVAVQ